MAPGISSEKVGELSPGAAPITWRGEVRTVGSTEWLGIQDGKLSGWASSRYLTCRLSPLEAEARIASRTRKVIVALHRRDMRAFAKYIHPELGVRFSPSAYVLLDQDVVLRAEEIRTGFEDSERRVWGYADGTGSPLNMTFAEYFERFVYNRNYVNVEHVAYNRRIGIGNTIDNTLMIYGSGSIVEYYAPATDSEGMTWSSLRIVFSEVDGVPFVVGLIHDQWTI